MRGTEETIGRRTVGRRAAASGRSYRKRALTAVGALLLAACAMVPITGRQQVVLFSPAEEVQLGLEAYDQLLADQTLVTSGPARQQVDRVVARLIAVAEADAPDVYDWQVSVVQDPATVNAWALPGGPMAVYTGILPVTESDAGLAVVMAHEIGHVVARHGAERMTQEAAKQGIFELAKAYDQRLAQLETLGDALVQLTLNLPWGRKQELEADRIGLIYMARAGYDPREAVRFWGRMDALSGGASGPAWLSTHPSHSQRVEQLQKFLPEALQEYSPGGTR